MPVTDLPPITQPFLADTSRYVAACRITAKHLTALADELDALDIPATEAAEVGWVKDVRVEWLTAPMAEPWVRLTHRPTETVSEKRGGNAYHAALSELATTLAAQGEISINDGRAAIGLPPWEREP